MSGIMLTLMNNIQQSLGPSFVETKLSPTSSSEAKAGSAVSISDDGTVVAIGMPSINTNDGAVAVYQYNGTSWTQLSNITPPNTDGEFGYSVKTLIDDSGNIIICVGAPNSLTGSGERRGVVRFYQYDNVTSTWSQIGSDIEGSSLNERFGQSIDTFAYTDPTDGYIIIVAIGAPFGSGGGTLRGYASVYNYTISFGFAFQMGSNINGSVDNGEFGQSVSITNYTSNSTYLIGVGATNSNIVDVYAYDSVWYQLALNITGTSGSNFGSSVSIKHLGSDDIRVAIGAPSESTGGKIYYYDYTSSSWTQKASVTSAVSGANFGKSLKLNSTADALIVGAPGENTSTGTSYLYNYSAGSLTLSNQFLASDGGTGDLFGQSVDFNSDNSNIVIGAPEEDALATNSGSVYVYSEV